MRTVHKSTYRLRVTEGGKIAHEGEYSTKYYALRKAQEICDLSPLEHEELEFTGETNYAIADVPVFAFIDKIR